MTIVFCIPIRLGEDLKRDAKRKVELDKRIEEATGDQDNFRSDIDDHNKGFYELKKKKDGLQAERNELCRKEMNLQQSLTALKEELGKADQTLRSMAGKPILNGRDSVKRVLEIFREKGGQVWPLIPIFFFPFSWKKFMDQI